MMKMTQTQRSDLPEEIIERSELEILEEKLSRLDVKSEIIERSELPEEIMEEILSRLDVKSLMRFRCVSKSYRSLIDSKRFIKLHYQKSTRDTALAHHRVLFFTDTRSREPKVSECSLLSFIDSSSHKAASESNSSEANLLSFIDPSELNSPLLSCFGSSSYKAASELNFPTNIPPYYAISCLGCCNGLVCILLERSNKIGSRFMLWNPSTRISKEVPHIDKNKMMVRSDFTCYGFGWDESSDDYKIVAIVKVEEGQSQTAKIYSLKSDSWKQNDGWDGLSRSWHLWIKVGVFTTGKLQWECLDRPKSLHEWELVAFDLEREVFQIVEQPFSFDDDYSLFLGTFGECLAVQCTYDDYKEIWVMKEFGVKESWEKVMVLDDFDEYGIWTSPSVAASFNGGIGIGKGGEIIFMNIKYYVTYLAYNEKKKCLYYATSTKDFDTDFETDIHSEIYIESLVSPLE